jgi:beta-mannosidase
MIRLHCHFSNREFYDLADEKGVLVWQDFLEAWYPHDRAFSRRAAELYDNHVRYVRNHASVALWAASDEEDFENYRDLTKHLAARPSLLDPQMRPVVRSTGRYGDSHVYYGWYGGSIWEYAKLDREFVSEMGATALPDYETLVKFMPNAWPIGEHAAEWKWRRLQIDEALRAWGDPAGMSLREYIPRTQAYVARLFQLALERMRRRKHEGAGGAMHFHAIDIWPSVTMAAIDFERVPTKVYDTVRRSFAPVAASFEYDRDRWKQGETFECGVWAINDRWTAIDGARVRWRVVDGKGGEQARGEWAAAMPPDSARRLGAVRWRTSAPGPHQLRAKVLDSRGEEISENVFEWEVR